MATKHQSESVDKAMALLLIHYENVVILGSTYDPTTHNTSFIEAVEGNDYAIKGHVEEFAQTLREMGASRGCGPDCECECGDDDDEPIELDDDDRFNQ